MKEENLESLEMEVDNDWFNEKAKKAARKIEPGKSLKTEDGYSDSSWSWRLSIGLACVILGIVISLLFKTYKKEGVVNTLYGSRKDMAVMVKYLQTERSKLQTELADARKTISEFEEAATKGLDETSTIKKQLNKAREEAGLSALKGPGIIVWLNDSPVKPKEGDDPNYYIIHDIDLLALVNELWASGAEAISINGQRIVVTSAIRCVGPTITINAVRLTPPYEVRAIGPASNLETGLKYTGGFMDSMSPNIERGVQIKIEKKEEVTIPPYKGSLVNRFAKTYKPDKEDKR